MEKMMVLIYDVALEKVVMDRIDSCGITGYTKIPRVFGKGRSGGPRMGTHVWPGENEMLWVVTEEEKINSMLDCSREIKEDHKGKGIKAFVLPVETEV